jgi:hypothetical protein
METELEETQQTWIVVFHRFRQYHFDCIEEAISFSRYWNVIF